MPKVSVLLPTHNGSRLVERSLKSVLSQSFKNFELVVIDDGSTDDTAKIIRKFADRDKRIYLISNKENTGIQRALNYGLKLAKGEYIARIDDDDEWIHADKIKKQVEFLDKNPEYVLVGTGVVFVDEDRNELFRLSSPGRDRDIRPKMLMRSYFTHSAVMFRKDVALQLGGYNEDEAVRHVEDYDLWLKLGTVGKIANLSPCTVKFMLHEKSISAQNKREQFRKNIRLIKNFRKFYPRFLLALIYGYSKIGAYLFYEYLPKPLRRRIFKAYKNL
jgi:glycosyltransferase involved in cell wall biosynthesis